jgi:hypothetical protein
MLRWLGAGSSSDIYQTGTSRTGTKQTQQTSISFSSGKPHKVSVRASTAVFRQQISNTR